MIKRILLALALAASLGGAVVACNTPAGTSNPTSVTPSQPAVSAPAASDASPAASEMMASPSAS
ncbi:MAG: hypothetical protein H0U52_13150 [Chloroflexi bacterium]|nr:hypothetical protein [Chloroflexota bacterium]